MSSYNFEEKNYKCQIFKTVSQFPTFQTSLIKKSFQDSFNYTLKNYACMVTIFFLTIKCFETRQCSHLLVEATESLADSRLHQQEVSCLHHWQVGHLHHLQVVVFISGRQVVFTSDKQSSSSLAGRLSSLLSDILFSSLAGVTLET